MPDQPPLGGTAPEVSLLTTKVPPPQALYVGREDLLLLAARQTTAGPLVFNVRLRFMLPSGVIVPMVLTSSIAVGPTEQQALFNLTEGWILSCIVDTIGGVSLQRAQAYARVFLQRGLTTSGFVLDHIICQGYCGGQNATNLTGDSAIFPGGRNPDDTDGRGRLRVVTVANPAAGADFSDAVPSGLIRRFISLRMTLTTAVGGANREALLAFDDGVSVYYIAVPPTTQAAATAQGYNYGGGGPNQALVLSENSVGLPVDMIQPTPHRVRSNVVNIAAGDQISGIAYLVEEWMSGP